MRANETVVEQDIQNPAIEENEDVHSEFDDAWNEAEEDAGLRDSETAKLRDSEKDRNAAEEPEGEARTAEGTRLRDSEIAKLQDREGADAKEKPQVPGAGEGKKFLLQLAKNLVDKSMLEELSTHRHRDWGLGFLRTGRDSGAGVIQKAGYGKRSKTDA